MIDVSGYIDPSLEYEDILLRAHPDAGYEYFWLNFKDSVGNVIHQQNKTEKMQLLALEVKTVTNRLNEYKKRHEYDQIGQAIQSFLKCFFWAILAESNYHIAIAYTNFKRWIRCCQLRREIPVDNVTPMDPLADADMAYLYFLHRIGGEIPTYLVNADTQDREQGLKYVLQQALATRSTAIFNKLLEHYPDWMRSEILSKYNINLPKGIKNGTKVMKLLSQ